MPTVDIASNITAPTQFLTVKNEKYAYRRFGSGPTLPLVLLQHFTGTLDNWDPAVTDSLAQRGEVILFESAGLGRSSGKVPEAVSGNPSTRSLSLTALASRSAMFSDFLSAARSHNKWCWIVRQCSEE